MMGPAVSQKQRHLKLFIVGTEPAMRTEFAELCRQDGSLEIVGEAASGRAALGGAENLRPDVMLVDVRLPDMDGFELLQVRQPAPRPLYIMTSHRPEHAARAFEAGAVDYLLKPVSADRFCESMLRARDRCFVEDGAKTLTTQQILQLLGRRPKYLMGERQRRLYPLDVEKIDYVEADGNYVTIRVGAEEYISRDSIKRLSKELADFGYVRIDRSVLINVRSVAFAEPAGHGTLAFTLHSGVCLYSSRKYRDDIVQVLPWHQCRSGTAGG